jgi:hypothetical protein
VAVAATAVLVHNCTEGEETAKNIANHANGRAQAGDGTHYVSGVSPQELPGYVHQVLDGEVPGIETRYLSERSSRLLGPGHPRGCNRGRRWGDSVHPARRI